MTPRPGNRSKAGKPRPGTGGYGRRKLEGKGPTPAAEQRPGHPAQRRAAAAAKAASKQQARGKPQSGPEAPVSRQPAGRPPAGTQPAGRAGSRTRVLPGGPEIVAGRSAVLDALRARVPSLALHVGPRLDSDERIGEAVKLAADRAIPVIETGKAELDRLVPGIVHQGLALRVRPFDYAHPDELAAAGQSTLPLIVALDGVTDPAELGAVVRATAAFGGNGVVIPARRSAEVTSAAWRASAGAVARIPVAQAPNLPRTLAAYAQAGMFVVGVAPGRAPDATDLAALDLADQPLVLVTGPALSRLVAQQCDAIVTLGTSDRESLTAPVAAGIALYQVARLRG